MSTPAARKSLTLRQTAYEAWRFIGRVLVQFGRNKGFLLAGGIAYNMLLSIIPLLAVFLAALSQLFDPSQVLVIISSVLELLIPAPAIERIVRDITQFLEHPELFGGISLIVVLFFSSLAFRMLQDAMAVIFGGPRVKASRKKQRSFWAAAFLPYAYIGVVVLVLAALTTVVVILGALKGGTISVFGISLGDLPTIALSLSSLAGEVLLFASIYRVMPVTHVEFRRALVGGLTAALLWEIVRRIVVWWFANISLVDVVYGSLATVIVVLLGLEIAAVILLLGGQIIAELQHSEDAGLPWYEAAPLERAGPTGRFAALPSGAE